MLGRSVTLFKLLGFDIKVDFSWVFLALLVTWSLATGYFPSVVAAKEGAAGFENNIYWIMGAAGAMGLFVSIVLHELSHSVVARRFGMKIRGITLFIFGGVAEMEEEPPSAVSEFLMAIAGPLMSLFLWWAFGNMAEATALPDTLVPVAMVLSYLALINLILAIFNMLPAFPLDGGRALRAALWYIRGDNRSATVTAARIGSGFGIAFIMSGVFFFITGNVIGGLWWALIGLFLRGAANAAIMQQDTQRILRGEPVWKFMVRDPITVPSHISVTSFVENYLYNQFHDVYPVVDQDKVQGLVVSKRVKSIPQSEWDQKDIGSIMEPLTTDNTIAPNVDSTRALSLMNRTGNSRLLVMQDGQLLGIVALKDMLRLLELKVDL